MSTMSDRCADDSRGSIWIYAYAQRRSPEKSNQLAPALCDYSSIYILASIYIIFFVLLYVNRDYYHCM